MKLINRCVILYIIKFFYFHSIYSFRLINKKYSKNNTSPTHLLMARLVLWDIDGTLCDSFKLGFESTLQVLKMNLIEKIDENQYHLGNKL